MKGYNVEAGFMGFVDGDYILFANESDYTDYKYVKDGFNPGRKLVWKGNFFS